MFSPKPKKLLIAISLLGVGVIFTYTTAILLRFSVNDKEECRTGLGISQAMKDNFEGAEWTKLEENESLHSMFVYGAQRAQSAPKNLKGQKKENSG